MWQYQVKTLESKLIRKYSIFDRQEQLTYWEIIELWQNNPNFCTFFNSLLADSPFSAYFWETPPITLATVDRKFEFVLVDNPRLSRLEPNSHAFKKYFTTTSIEQTVVTFPNLRRDATLVVPCPKRDNTAYTHIANFVRQAPCSQQQVLWETVGTVLKRNLNQQPIWVSTSGLGVYWLHIRLDSIPKYYFFQPYKQESN